MKGCKHIVDVSGTGVYLYNDDDSYCEQLFETAEELQEFIDKLIAAKKEKFPE